MVHEGLIAMRRGLSLFAGHHRINKGLLLSRLYRWRVVLWALAALAVLAVALACTALLRTLTGMLG